jgi:hypothetical protein
MNIYLAKDPFDDPDNPICAAFSSFEKASQYGALFDTEIIEFPIDVDGHFPPGMLPFYIAFDSLDDVESVTSSQTPPDGLDLCSEGERNWNSCTVWARDASHAKEVALALMAKHRESAR